MLIAGTGSIVVGVDATGKVFRIGGWGYGFNDPFFGGPDVRSYTVFTSGVDVKIDRRADGRHMRGEDGGGNAGHGQASFF